MFYQDVSGKNEKAVERKQLKIKHSMDGDTTLTTQVLAPEFSLSNVQDFSSHTPKSLPLIHLYTSPLLTPFKPSSLESPKFSAKQPSFLFVLESMAATLSMTTSSPLLSSKTRGSVAKNLAPRSVLFPSRRAGRMPAVRAQSSGEHKDTSVDVHVSNQGNQGTQMERKPRRMAVDISPFGKFFNLIFDAKFRLVLHEMETE